MFAIVIGILLGLFALVMMIPNPILGSIILAIIILCNLDIVLPIVYTVMGIIGAIGLLILWDEFTKSATWREMKREWNKGNKGNKKPTPKLKYDPSEDGWC